jgi:hypothetical protein
MTIVFIIGVVLFGYIKEDVKVEVTAVNVEITGQDTKIKVVSEDSAKLDKSIQEELETKAKYEKDIAELKKY